MRRSMPTLLPQTPATGTAARYTKRRISSLLWNCRSMVLAKKNSIGRKA